MLQLPSQQSELSSRRPLLLHARQVSASQRPLEQSALVLQKEPFAHLPQSALHSSPEFWPPQISVPSHWLSPQDWAQTPMQLPQ